MTEVSPYQTPDSQVYTPDGNEFDDTRIMSMSQRIGRVRFLAYNSLSYVAFFAPLGLLGFLTESSSGNNEMLGIFAGIMLIILYIAFIVVGFIIARRRLHDLNQTGWMGLLFLVPVVNLFFGLYLMFAPGNKHVNQYGSRPSPNTMGTWIAGTIMPIIFVIGIVAAIALPAYQDYTERVKAAQSQSGD